jgi:hypothetical protein
MRRPQPDPATWGEPEQVNPKNVLVEGDRLPVDEDIVAGPVTFLLEPPQLSFKAI